VTTCPGSESLKRQFATTTPLARTVTAWGRSGFGTKARVVASTRKSECLAAFGTNIGDRLDRGPIVHVPHGSGELQPSRLNASPPAPNPPSTRILGQRDALAGTPAEADISLQESPRFQSLPPTSVSIFARNWISPWKLDGNSKSEPSLLVCTVVESPISASHAAPSFACNSKVFERTG
jgi:hypothetical protein